MAVCLMSTNAMVQDLSDLSRSDGPHRRPDVCLGWLRSQSMMAAPMCSEEPGYRRSRTERSERGGYAMAEREADQVDQISDWAQFHFPLTLADIQAAQQHVLDRSEQK